MSGIGSSTRLEYSANALSERPVYLGMTAQTWGKIAAVATLFALVFWPNLRRLWLKTNPFTGEANWGHAIVVPAIGLYYLFIHREELLEAKGQQFIWGSFTRPNRLVASLVLGVVGGAVVLLCHARLGTIYSLLAVVGWTIACFGAAILLLDWSLGTTIFGIAVYVYGIYPGQNDYIKDVGMIVTLFGIVLLMYGWQVMRIAWFPIVFLICAIPWPGLVYSWIAEPLQQMAANVAVIVLRTTGVDAFCSGTKIIIHNSEILKPDRVLNVAEACAGMRSLMTFITVGGAIAFLSPRPLWQRVIIVVSSIPIAIFCNVLRISGQGLLDHYVSPEWSESFAHQFVGMVMLLPAFFLILGVAYGLEKLLIEEADDSMPLAPLIVKPPPSTIAMSPAPKVAALPATPAFRVEQAKPAPVAAGTSQSITESKPPVAPRSPGSLIPSAGRAGTLPPRPRNLGPVPPRAIVPPRTQAKAPNPSNEEQR